MMVSPFEIVIQNLDKIGALRFLFPFFLTSAVFYGLLRKSQLFGKPEENVSVNAVIAIVAAFLIWAYPVLTGIAVENILSKFLFQGLIALVTIVIGLMISGMFVPGGLGEYLGKTLEKKTTFWVGIVIFGLLVATAIFISSGAYSIIFPQGLGFEISEDIVLSVVTLAALVGTMVAVVWFTGKEKTKKK